MTDLPAADGQDRLSEAVESLAVWLYEQSGGIFWRGETTWQDRHREEARQWFAYSDLLAARAPQPAPTPGVGDEGMRERLAEAEVAFLRDQRLLWRGGSDGDFDRYLAGAVAQIIRHRTPAIQAHALRAAADDAPPDDYVDAWLRERADRIEGRGDDE